MHYSWDLWSKITLLPRIFSTKLALGFLNCIPSFVQRMSFFVHLPKKSAEMNDHSFYLWKFSPSDENEWMQKTNPAFCIHRKISGWHDWKYFSHFFALVQKRVNLQFKCPFTFYQDFQNLHTVKTKVPCSVVHKLTVTASFSPLSPVSWVRVYLTPGAAGIAVQQTSNLVADDFLGALLWPALLTTTAFNTAAGFHQTLIDLEQDSNP